MNYFENNYLENDRITNDEYKSRLTAFQIPAIIEHFQTLENKQFLDLGCGDIVLGEFQEILGRPIKYFVQDINKNAVDVGINRLKGKGIDTSNIFPLISPYFDLSKIENQRLDCAFSNSLFSHLTLNSILICLNNLYPKMKRTAKYMSSMIIIPENHNEITYEWKVKYGAISHSARDPYHYKFSLFKKYVESTTNFEVVQNHAYGHPFQRLVEFKAF